MKLLLIPIFFFVFLLDCADLHVREFSLDLGELPKSLSINKKSVKQNPPQIQNPTQVQNPTQKTCPTKHTTHPQKRKDLINILKNVNDNEDLSYIDTSQIKNMNKLFIDSNKKYFNGDISCWDVSSVTNMEDMFRDTITFNQDISDWDVSNVTSMDRMFLDSSSFNQDISGWDVSNVTNMVDMFARSKFNQNISNWDVSGVRDMQEMFWSTSAFNNGGQPLNWGNKVRRVTTMRSMFSEAKAFNLDISNWNVSSVTDMQWMFQDSPKFNNGGNPYGLNRWKTYINKNRTNIKEVFQNTLMAKKNQYPSWCKGILICR